MPALPARGPAPPPEALGSPLLNLNATISADAPSSLLNLVPMILRAFARHWWRILALWMVGTGGLSYLIYLKIHPMYEASSLLHVAPFDQDLFKIGIHTGEGYTPFLETQVQLVTSPNVLTTVVAEPKVATIPMVRTAQDAEAELRKHVAVEIVPRTYLIKVSLTLPSAAEAATIVNAVVAAYLATTTEWSDEMTHIQIKKLEAYQRELQDQADKKQEAWLTLASQGNVDLDDASSGQKAEVDLNDASSGRKAKADLPVLSRSRITLNEYQRVRGLLFKTNIELVEAEAVLGMRQAELQGNAADSNSEARLQRRAREAFHADPAIASIVQEVEKAHRKLEKVNRLSRSGSDPARISALHQLNSLSARYQELWDLKREDLLARLREQSPDDLGRAVQQTTERVETLKASKAGYEKALSQIEVSNKQEGTDAVRVALVREALAGVKTMQDAVNLRLEQLRFEAKGEARISKISEAQPGTKPLKDQRRMLWIITPIGVLALVLGLFVMLEIQSGRVVDIDKLSKRMLVEVYAVPLLPGLRLDSEPPGNRNRENQLQKFLQSLDHIRVALCDKEAAGKSGRTLMITSATGAEGKTTLTTQLAACCAKAGILTLVIDADLRRATLSRILGEDRTPGLCDVLEGNLSAEETLVAVREGGFHLLPAGTPGQDLGRLLRSPRFSQALSRYRQMFDLVLIDTPPVLPVTDALTVGRWSDGAILVVRYDTSRFALVDHTQQRLLSAGIPILKTIFNGMRTSQACYGYDSYSYGERTARPPEPPSTTAEIRLQKWVANARHHPGS